MGKHAGTTRADDEDRVLRHVAAQPSGTTAAKLRDALGARMPPDRLERATVRLRGRELLVLDDGVFRVTEAGMAHAAAPASKLPVLPEPLTPHVAFTCTRLGPHLNASQCASRWAVRGDEPCGRAENGTPAKEGCPVGARAWKRLEERRRGEQVRGQERRKARAV